MALWQFLAVALFLAFVTDSRALPAALILLANWSVNTVMADATGTQFNWIAMACVDYVSALLILMICPNKWTVAIVVLYAAEMIGHVAFGVSSQGPWPQYRYWYLLHYAAWAQAWLLLAWSGIEGGKVVRSRFDLDRFVEPIASLPHRLGLQRKRDR